MTYRIISANIAMTFDKHAGQAQETNDFDRNFIAEYSAKYEALPAEIKALAFRNVIIHEGRCGFASGGSIQYLVNTDSGNRYRVTIRTHWRQGIDSGQYDSTYVTEAGGRTMLGCTDSGAIPVAYYTRSIVGEVRI